MKRQLILAAVFTVPALMLGIVAATVAMTVSLQGDIGMLAKRLRSTAQAEKALRTDIAVVRDELAVIQAPPAALPATQSAPAPVAPMQAAPVKAAAIQTTSLAAAIGPGRAVRASASVPPECTFRTGGSAGLMECMRQHQDRIGPIPSPQIPQPLYR
jgi:hypothetical protein